MAERRMFAKAIVGAGKFLRMPPTARLLYYDLGMAADDDGFVEAYTVMTSTKATEDDLRILVAKGYVQIVNEDLVALICDWNSNNLIRADRYKPSIYKDLILQIGNGIPNDNQMTTNGKPSIGKDSIGKVSIGKDRLGKVKAEQLEYFPEDEKLNEAFERYIQHRKKLRKPMDAYKCELAVSKLKKLSNGDNDLAIQIIEQSINEGWQGLFELKQNKTQPKKSIESIAEKWANA